MDSWGLLSTVPPRVRRHDPGQQTPEGYQVPRQVLLTSPARPRAKHNTALCWTHRATSDGTALSLIMVRVLYLSLTRKSAWGECLSRGPADESHVPAACRRGSSRCSSRRRWPRAAGETLLGAHYSVPARGGLPSHARTKRNAMRVSHRPFSVRPRPQHHTRNAAKG